MPELCGFSWPPEVDQAIRDRAAAYGLPLDLALTFIAAESLGFDSYSAGDEVGFGLLGFNDDPGLAYVTTGQDGHRGLHYPNGFIAWESYYHPGRYYWSHGLLQLQTGGGQGTGMLWSQLINPWTTFDVGFRPIADAFRQCWSVATPQETFIRCVMRNSGHPGNVPDGTPVFELAFANIWPKWQCIYQALVNLPIIPAPVTPPFPVPPLPNPLPPPPDPNSSGSLNMNILPWVALGLGAVYLVSKMQGQPTIFKKKIILKGREPGLLKKILII